MILGIGVDVVHPVRLKRWESIAGLFERFFHKDELKQCKSRLGEVRILSLAARFAAKEAFGKALGSGLSGLSLKDMAVLNNSVGKPEMILEGTAKIAFEKLGGKKVFISLSHEQQAVIAMCVIEGNVAVSEADDK